MKEYRKRVADRVLMDKLEAKGAVLIEGPKWCGKTTTAMQIAKSEVFMQDPANSRQNLAIAEIQPSLLLKGETPRLLDEWQLAPQLWDAVRFEVDQRDSFGQFILTGSTVPAADMSQSHSGTGRISRMLMRSMTLHESGESNGSVSLQELFSNPELLVVESSLSIEDLAFLICRGGWPKAVGQSHRVALQQAFDYYDAIIESDISRVDGISRNPQRVKNLMRSYSRFIGSDTKIATIQADMLANDVDSLNYDTILSYINALKQIFVIEDLPAWNPKLRSKSAIRKTDTRYFTDPSIAVAALGIGPQDLLNDLETMGFLFESLCVRDLRVFGEALDGSIYHYRDKTNLECDVVIHLRNGKYGFVEVKLGGSAIESAAGNLLKLQQKIDTQRMNQPSFLMILTGGKYGYRRPDGVYVVPIGCLKE
ncbi:MAG: ATP-binding protein [Sphaerochaetaceae bacterium]